MDLMDVLSSNTTYRQNLAHLKKYIRLGTELVLLKSSDTWGTPDKVADTTFVSHKQIPYRVKIQAWSNMLMCGGKNLPIHQHPFTLVNIRLYNRASFIPEAALVDCNGRQPHEVIFTQHMPSLRPGTFLSFWQTKTLADKFQIPDDEYEKR